VRRMAATVMNWPPLVTSGRAGTRIEAGHKRVYTLRRKSEARTRSRNFVSAGEAGGGLPAGFDSTTAGAALFAAFFAALPSLAFQPSCPVRPAADMGQIADPT
jgi:hypothetical protein